MFFPFRLDRAGRRLYRDEAVVPLRPKTFAVLCQLVDRAGEVVSRDELLDAVWADVAVTPDMPRLSVGELRRALGDDPKAPRYIETVARAGYCFIAPLEREPGPADSSALVGRDDALAEIERWLDAALAGRRQLGFVCGEIGAGKTTLLDAALARMRARRTRGAGPPLQIAVGQCVEQYGEAEPYMPVLEALGRLGQPQAGAGSRTQMLRGLADAIQAQAAERPLVLALEDLHWSDPSTVALLALLAQRPEPARLLVIATLRPADALARTHPAPALQQELRRKGLCQELRLEGLGRSEVAHFLADRLGGEAIAPSLIEFCLTRTEGNPFFLVALCDHLREQRLLVANGDGWRLADEAGTAATTPAGVRAMIEARLDALSGDEVGALETASVAGVEFQSPLVAAALGSAGAAAEQRLEPLEALCDGLARREELLLQTDEPAADGRSYAFRHALYRQVLYERIPPARARRLHQAMGEWLEAAHRGATTPVAATLAAHFERGGDLERALRYHRDAADSARSHFADPEVALHLEAAARVLRASPASPERAAEELQTLQEFSSLALGMKGLADERLGAVFERKLALAESLGLPVPVFVATAELFFHRQTRAELAEARRLAGELVARAERSRHPTVVFVANTAMGSLCCNAGELDGARTHLERARVHPDPEARQTAPVDLGALNRRYLADVLALLGFPEQARRAGAEALARAERVGRPADLAFGQIVVAELATLLGDPTTARRHAERALDVSKEYDLPLFAAAAGLVQGWALARLGSPQDGLRIARGALADLLDLGQLIGTSHFCAVLADAALCAGDADAALDAIERGLAHAAATGEHRADSELARLRGEALPAEAEAHFREALAIARRQRARLLELRAATGLARLERARGRAGPAREALATLYAGFDEGFDSAALVEARALL